MMWVPVKIYTLEEGCLRLSSTHISTGVSYIRRTVLDCKTEGLKGIENIM